MLQRWFVVMAILVAAGCQSNTGAPSATPAETTRGTAEQAKTAAQAEQKPAQDGAAALQNQTNTAPAQTGEQTAAQANPEAKDMNPALLNPALANETAPAKFKAKFDTTKGAFVVEVDRDWAPNGADRFYNLVKIGFYDDVAFFRVLDGFVAQFGIHGDPNVMNKWRDAKINDDAVKQSNVRGNLVFATAGPNTRTTQLFINFGNNTNLDGMGFSPFGKVVEGMEVVDALYKGYGEGAPRGMGPNQMFIQQRGNEYLKESFPELDFVKTATIVE